MNAKYKIGALMLGTVLFLGSCKKEVTNNPYYMGGTPDEVFSNEGMISAAAVGLYDGLQNAEFLGGRAQIYVDIRGLDVNPPTYFGNMSTFSNTSSDATTAAAWQGAYNTIYKCNLFLEKIENAKQLISASNYAVYTAEAKFIRGLTYFYALNFWGQQYSGGTLGVPIVLKSYDGATVYSESANVPRSNVNDVYAQIISDMKYAEANLLGAWSNNHSNRVRATKGAARAMLSRIYLYKGNNDSTIIYADKVAAASDGALTYSLAADEYTDVFAYPADASKEIILFVGHNASDNPNTNNAVGQHYSKDLRHDITVSQDYIKLFEPTDTRISSTFLTGTTGTVYTNKYTAGSKAWAPIIRYAEVLLNKAEALVKQNKTIDGTAIGLLNTVRQRSNASVRTAAYYANWNALLDDILAERRRELAFEGHGSWDLFRNQKGIPAGRGVSTAPAIAFPNNYFALPIPSTEVQKFSGLVQNEGYN